MPIDITMPALSPTMTEGSLSRWIKKEGDKVSSGDVIAEIETDKATMEVESIEDGTIGRIIVKEGTNNVLVNSVIAVLLEEGEDPKILDSYKIKQPAVEEQAPDPAQASEDKKTTPSVLAPNLASSSQITSAPVISLPPVAENPNQISKKDNSVKSSPLARRVAKEKKVNLSQITGTGPRGRVILSDVEDFLKLGHRSGSVVRNPVDYYTVKNDNMRKVIAQRLLQSKQHVPHFYLSIDCQIDKLLEARKEINELFQEGLAKDEKPPYKITVNDFVIKAVALSLKKIPEVNASWTDEMLIKYNNVDISIAVALEGGLITPIIRNADQKSLPYLSNEMKDLAKRAREGKLSLEEFQGGGFSISNLGMYGIKQFNAIINPPQSCILALGAGEKRAVISDDGKVVAATVMTVTLSSDHRVVDGAIGAEFLEAFKGYIEKPSKLLI